MEFTYETVTRTATEQGVPLLRITVCYPVCIGDEPGVLHINAFEKRYAEVLAEGLLQAALQPRKSALTAYLAEGGRRSRFPTQFVELTGQASVRVGRAVWEYRYSSRCGGECVREKGTRVWDEKGILLHRSGREV